MTSPSSQRTHFTLDVMGRYVCTGRDEAIRSTDQRESTAVTEITDGRLSCCHN